MAESKKLTEGMYNCVIKKTGEPKVYHYSTAQTLSDKGVITIGKKIKKYIPNGALGNEKSEDEK